MYKYNFIYITTNKLNGFQYVGKHSSNIENDEYMGSGTLISEAIKRYGKNNFESQILEHCDFDDLKDKEKFWIGKILEKNPKLYNIKNNELASELFHLYDKENFKDSKILLSKDYIHHHKNITFSNHYISDVQRRLYYFLVDKYIHSNKDFYKTTKNKLSNIITDNIDYHIRKIVGNIFKNNYILIKSVNIQENNIEFYFDNFPITNEINENYTFFKLNHITNFINSDSQRFYEIINHFNFKPFELYLSNIKDYFLLWDKDYSDIRKIINNALDEINSKLNIKIDIVEQKTGIKVTSLKFYPYF
jgi:hypothetical protein